MLTIHVVYLALIALVATSRIYFDAKMCLNALISVGFIVVLILMGHLDPSLMFEIILAVVCLMATSSDPALWGPYVFKHVSKATQERYKEMTDKEKDRERERLIEFLKTLPIGDIEKAEHERAEELLNYLNKVC